LIFKEILKKQEKGRRLAMEVTMSAPLDKLDRDRRYEIFINKMTHLYKAQKYQKQKIAASRKLMRGANYLYH
jgi:hypothetical protein